MENKNYQLFDGDDDKYALVVTSNKNIRKVCEVLTQCFTLSDQHRLYYAKHGDIPPSKKEGGEAVYNFKERFDDVTVWPALAEVLFYDFPSLVDYDPNGKAFILEKQKEQFDNLIRSEVMRGRDDFLGKFGVSPPEARSLLDALANVQSPLIIDELIREAEKAETQKPSTEET